MIEIVLMIFSVVGMARIAAADDKSGVLWGTITLVLCLASAVVPLPILRIPLAFLVAFGLLVASKMLTEGR